MTAQASLFDTPAAREVTFRENVLRGTSPVAIGARRDHCVNGHPFSPENTRVNDKGHRRCLTCELTRGRQRIEREKGRPVEVAPKDKTECKNGHPFTPENTHIRKEGGRACRACASESTARYRARMTDEGRRRVAHLTEGDTP